jgi:tetratricopeptide (TPR) repeat protein
LKRNHLLALLAVIVALMATLAGIQKYRAGRAQTKSVPAQATGADPQANAGYVDPSICESCHADIAQTFHKTGMGRSFSRPGPKNVVEDFKVKNSFYNKASDQYFTMIERDGKFYERRHQIGYDGKETNVLENSIDFILGSANHARTYLHRTPDGKLMELPVSWYSEKGGYWAMSPGYDRKNHMGFRRLVLEDCLSCHNGYPRKDTRSDAKESTVFGALPNGIDCQRCHGPGETHVNTVVNGGTLEQIQKSIVNPAKLARDRQLETCLQCHLETTSSPLPHEIRRYEHAAFSYRPGQPLGNYYLQFDRARDKGDEKRDDRFEIAHQGYRLMKSACFQQSQMTCITCHDPHNIPRGAEAVKYYIAKCESCHEAPHPSGAPKVQGMAANATCLDCHMPKRRAEDAVHVVVTDHFIRRRQAARDLLAPLDEATSVAKGEYQGEVVLYYPEKLSDSAKSELYLAQAQVEDGANMKAGIPRLRQAIEKHKPDEPGFYFQLGHAYSKQGDLQASIHWNEQALQHDANYQPALKDLAASLIATGNYPRAAEVMEKVIALSQPDSSVFTDLGNAYLRQGLVDKAEPALQKALSLDPEMPQANNLMGLLEVRKGNSETAEKYFRDAIRIQPDLAEAQNNLGNLLAGRRDYAQAEYHFEKAVDSDPTYTEALHSLGMVLVLQGSYDKALKALEQTVRLDPSQAQAHTDLADLLAGRGNIRQAMDEYQQAIQVNPSQYEAYLGLGKLLVQQGRAVEARRYLEKASQSPDPAVRQEAFASMR